MLRIFSVLLFLSVVCIAQDCQAQRHCGVFQRIAPTPQMQSQVLQQQHQPVQSYALQHAQAAQIAHAQPVKPVWGRHSTYRNPTISRILDGPMTNNRNPIENDSRYIGGFHQSHFDNIGIPSGDIGLRGNAYQWRTW